MRPDRVAALGSSSTGGVRGAPATDGSRSASAATLGFLRDLQRRFGTAVLLVRHARKSGATRPGQALRGTSELHAWGDGNLYQRRRDKQIVMIVEHRAAPGLTDIEVELADHPKGRGGAEEPRSDLTWRRPRDTPRGFTPIGGRGPSNTAKTTPSIIVNTLRWALSGYVDYCRRVAFGKFHLTARGLVTLKAILQGRRHRLGCT